MKIGTVRFGKQTDVQTDGRHNEANSSLLYVQVTVHCDKFRIKQPTRCIKHPKFILS
jgi:hypothetical protein